MGVNSPEMTRLLSNPIFSFAKIFEVVDVHNLFDVDVGLKVENFT